MAFSKEDLFNMTSKEDVIAYASSFGYEGFHKKTKIEKLKALVLEAHEKASADPVSNLLDQLQVETDKGFQEAVKVLDGEESVCIYHNGKLVDSVSPDGVKAWCDKNNQEFSVVSTIVGKYWLTHNNYSYKLEG